MSNRHRGISKVLLRIWRAEAAERQGWRCKWCGRTIAVWGKPAPVPDWACTADHIVPLWRGGRNVPKNIVAACWKCNNERDRADKPNKKNA